MDWSYVDKESGKTKEGELIDSMGLHRGGLAVHERKFCERIDRFIEHILPVELVAQCERAHGLIFGTQTLTSIITDRKGYNKVTRDNFLVVSAFCKYITRAYMVIGNLEKPQKAIFKKIQWANEFSLAKKLEQKHIKEGPVSPDALKIWIEKYYRRTSAGLVVLMMDSGGHKDYSPVMADLVKRYDNLYIMKMILGPGCYNIRLLRAYRGDVSIMNNNKFENCYRLVKRKGWEWARKDPKSLAGLWEAVNIR
jgi:hypothetical protein